VSDGSNLENKPSHQESLPINNNAISLGQASLLEGEGLPSHTQSKSQYASNMYEKMAASKPEQQNSPPGEKTKNIQNIICYNQYLFNSATGRE
jgi:hypothetical protein